MRHEWYFLENGKRRRCVLIDNHEEPPANGDLWYRVTSPAGIEILHLLGQVKVLAAELTDARRQVEAAIAGAGGPLRIDLDARTAALEEENRRLRSAGHYALRRARAQLKTVGGEAAFNRAMKDFKEKRRKERKLFRRILRWMDAQPDIEDDEDGWKLRNRIADLLEWGHE